MHFLTRCLVPPPFGAPQGPGMLFKALSVFALRDIDLTKIESRPMRENPLVLSMDYDDSSMRTFNYMFYIDFVGSLAEPKVQNALRHMEVGGGECLKSLAFVAFVGGALARR